MALARKRGVNYFCRRVTEEQKGHYKRSKIVFSLRANSAKVAKVNLRN
jgi:hypothetical protein